MQIDAPLVRDYLHNAFYANYEDVQDTIRDLAWNSGYVRPDDILDMEYVPLAKNALGDIKGNVDELFILTPIPNAKYKNASELKFHLEAFIAHMAKQRSALSVSVEDYKKRAVKRPRLSDVPPDPVLKALEVIGTYMSSAQTALSMQEMRDCNPDNSPVSDQLVISVLSRFGLVIKALNEKRRKDGGASRVGFSIADEYDVQDFLAALLQTHYEDVRKEEPIPSFGPGRSRCDLYLASHGIFIEIKTTLKKSEKDIFNDFKVDIPDYLSSERCKKLLFFVYDPNRVIINTKQFDDLKDVQVKNRSTEGIIFSN